MKQLFSTHSLIDYFNRSNNDIIAGINNYTQEALLDFNIEEIVSLLTEKYKIEKLTLDKNNSKHVEVVKRKSKSQYSSQNGFIEIEAAIYSIPFMGNKNFFFCIPSNFYHTHSVLADVRAKEVIAEISNENIFSGNENLEKKIVQRFEVYFDLLQQYVNAVNSDIENYNTQLSKSIETVFIKICNEVKNKEKTKLNLKPFQDQKKPLD